MRRVRRRAGAGPRHQGQIVLPARHQRQRKARYVRPYRASDNGAVIIRKAAQTGSPSPGMNLEPAVIRANVSGVASFDACEAMRLGCRPMLKAAENGLVMVRAESRSSEMSGKNPWRNENRPTGPANRTSRLM